MRHPYRRVAVNRAVYARIRLRAAMFYTKWRRA